MTELLQTDLRRFVGMNIKGTPAMSADAVEHDIEVAKDRASIVVTQETRWRWYWRRFRKILSPRVPRDGDRWRATPGFATAIARPVFAAQAVLHKGRLWRRVDHRWKLLHDGAAKISEDRYIRGVTLADRETDLEVEAITTHNVVNGDRAGDPARRQAMLAEDLAVLDAFLRVGRRAGRAMILQLDANVAKGSAAYDDLLEVLERHGGKIHGAHGVEYLVTFDGDDVAIEVTDDWVIPTTQLRTDHEGRGITFRLVARKRR